MDVPQVAGRRQGRAVMIADIGQRYSLDQGPDNSKKRRALPVAAAVRWCRRRRWRAADY
jgi:hypothetical protein